MTNDKKLSVTAVSSPNRCEICHQNDLYDAKTESCSRCKIIADSTLDSANQQIGTQLSKEKSYDYESKGLTLGFSIGSIIGHVVFFSFLGEGYVYERVYGVFACGGGLLGIVLISKILKNQISQNSLDRVCRMSVFVAILVITMAAYLLDKYTYLVAIVIGLGVVLVIRLVLNILEKLGFLQKKH